MITKRDIETYAEQLIVDRNVDHDDVIGHLNDLDREVIELRVCELLVERLDEEIRKRWPN